ncbi:MAG: hypothetical protein Q7J47_11385 [Azoarcus sp.]|nr:hypothetical protein [Azoarcus sp.]
MGERYRGGQAFQLQQGWDAGFEFSGADMGDHSDFFASLFGSGARAGKSAGSRMQASS